MIRKKQYNIDRDKHKINTCNYYQEESKKSLIILGSTNRYDNFHMLRQYKKDNGKSTTWNTYTITRDGIIYEHYNPIYYTNFIGDIDIDKKSVSVLLENMGPLYYNENNDNYYNDLNEKFDGDVENIFDKEWRGLKYYESYTKEQYNSTIFLCRLLCLELNINDDTYGHNAFEDNAKFYNGIISRSNLDVNIIDLNPSFDFKKFLKDLKK
jgi:hypothetical protein